MDLRQFKVLSFDCYGTLIDWEAGLLAAFGPWRDARPAQASDVPIRDETLLAEYATQEADVVAQAPTAPYPVVLAEAMQRTTAAFGAPATKAQSLEFGASVPNWPAFPDSAEALATLRSYYDLVIVSNVHRAGFAASNQHLGAGEFAAVITAEQVGAYKPAANHFQALAAQLASWGIAQAELLHVAQSLFHDHVPARREGLASVWINRRQARPGWGATPPPSGEFSYDLEFPSMAAFADAVRAAFEPTR